MTITVNNSGGGGGSGGTSSSGGGLFDPETQEGRVGCNNGNDTVASMSAVIYDQRGMKIRELGSEPETPGRCLTWDGRTDGGQLAADGVYMAVINADDGFAEVFLGQSHGLREGAPQEQREVLVAVFRQPSRQPLGLHPVSVQARGETGLLF